MAKTEYEKSIWKTGDRVTVVQGDGERLPEGATGTLIGVRFQHDTAWPVIKWDAEWKDVASDGWWQHRFAKVEG